jgi:general secretion pathway protein K
VDAIIDWIDPDEVPEPAGAETLYYQSLRPAYRAANTPLQTLLELRLIKGMTPEIIDRLSKFVTVYPPDGNSRINLNTADSVVIQALDPRITQSMAAEIVQARPFKAIQDLDNVGSAADLFRELRPSNVYDVKSDMFSARMLLTINEITRTGTVVIQRNANDGSGTVKYFRVL